jgi:Ran GTPase-activating protein (RanGAP) involved in mRNA processing and transport
MSFAFLERMDSIRKNTFVGGAVQMGGNRLGVEGAEALADALKTNTNLTDVSLPGNNIGDEGAKALAEALKKKQDYNKS